MSDSDERASTLELPVERSRTRFVLEIHDDEGTRTVPLAEDEIIVGSSKTAPIRLADAAVSEHHVALARTGPYVAVRDLGSKNGTYLGSARINDALGPDPFPGHQTEGGYDGSQDGRRIAREGFEEVEAGAA